MSDAVLTMPKTPEKAVVTLAHWLRWCGILNVTTSPRCIYWTAQSGKRWGWHMSDLSVPIAENVIVVLSVMATGHDREQCVDAALALLELTQLAILGAGGHKGNHGSDSL